MFSISSRLSCWPSKPVTWSRPAWSLKVCGPGERRDAVTFPQFHRFDRFDIRPEVELPRFHCPEGWFDLEIRPVERKTSPSPVTKAGVVVPTDAEVDGALHHAVRGRRAPLAHMLGFRQDVENESDRRVKLASDDHLDSFGIVMTAEPWRSGVTVVSLPLQLVRQSSIRSSRSLIARSYLAPQTCRG